MERPVDEQKLRIWKRAKELAKGDQRLALPIARLAFMRNLSLEGPLRCPTCHTVIESKTGRVLAHVCQRGAQLELAG